MSAFDGLDPVRVRIDIALPHFLQQSEPILRRCLWSLKEQNGERQNGQEEHNSLPFKREWPILYLLSENTYVP